MKELSAARSIAVALALALACACGGGSVGSGVRTRPPPAAAPPAAAPPAGTGDAPLTERECDALVARAIALGGAELARTLPADRQPTDAERAQLHAELRAAFAADCRAGTRRAYDCAIAARSLAELAACQRPSPDG